MFLNEELLKMCEDADVGTHEQINLIYSQVCRKCEDYYKSKLTLKMTKHDAKVLFDRTFNLFDLFVNQALKSKNRKLVVLGGLFKEYDFKSQFLADEVMGEIYTTL